MGKSLKAPQRQVNYVDPTQLEALTGPPAVDAARWGDYRRLREALFAELTPLTLVDAISIDDFVYSRFALGVVRRAGQAFTKVAAGDALRAVLRPSVPQEGELKRIVAGCMRGDAAAQQEARRLLQAAGYADDTVASVVIIQNIDSVERLARLEATVAARGDAALREVARRAAAGGAVP